MSQRHITGDHVHGGRRDDALYVYVQYKRRGKHDSNKCNRQQYSNSNDPDDDGRIICIHTGECK